MASAPKLTETERLFLMNQSAIMASLMRLTSNEHEAEKTDMAEHRRCEQLRRIFEDAMMVRIPSLFLLLVFIGPGALAADRSISKTQRPIVVQEAVSPAKAKRLAATLWPELSQREVDDVTAKAKSAGKGSIKIFCIDEVKCGDLASSLENAFESARWTVEVRYTSGMIPPGMMASPAALKLLGTIDPGFGLSQYPDPELTEIITIGEKPRGRLE